MRGRYRLGGPAAAACLAVAGMLLVYGPAVGAGVVSAAPSGVPAASHGSPAAPRAGRAAHGVPAAPQARRAVQGVPAAPSGVPAASRAGSVDQAPARDSAGVLAAARARLKQLLVGQHPTAELVGARPAAGGASPSAGPTQLLSNNWSGYADTGSGFDGVSATWVQPTITCTGQATTVAVFWVGIDGLVSNSVEQDGTLAECDNGTPSYFTWWEMFPSNAIQVVTTTNPGDSITASVSRASDQYFLGVTDNNTGQGFGTTQTCSNCANSSAEWIAEAPSGSSGVLPLAHFQQWSVTKATVASPALGGVISTFPDYAITMIDSLNVILARPTALAAAGNAFGVNFKPAILPRLPEPGQHPSGNPYPSRTPPPR